MEYDDYSGFSQTTFGGYTLFETSFAEPEQYDVFRDKLHVGYLRLRSGLFRADVPDCNGLMVFQAETEGSGRFKDYERDHFLELAVKAIDGHWRNVFCGGGE